MTERDPASLVDEIRRYVRMEVAAGFLNAKQVEQAAFDYFLDDAEQNPVTFRCIAGVETDKAFAEQTAAQRQWPEVTDCDRLDQAFAHLNESGIVARQNFSCCQNCGHAEIGEEINAAQTSGTGTIGYTFFHWQTTHGAVETGDLYLAYGDLEGSEAGSVRIGRAIVDALERHGLAVRWNGSLRQTIHVKLNWQRRVSEAMAERDPRMP
jgi:uncharacterized protein DUF6891